MATKESDISVACYEIWLRDPHNPATIESKAMRPSPMEKFMGRYGRREERRTVREQLAEKGYDVHGISWGEHPETKEKCLIVYIWKAGMKPTAQAAKAEVPPPRRRRTATSRRHAQRPETRKKP